MNINISAAWLKIQAMINGLIVLLPNIVVALIVFAIFLYLGRTLRGLVGRFNRRSGRSHNLGLVLGRFTQWLVVMAGLLVGLSIIIPSFHARDLIQLLGISGVAIGFAFRDIFQNFLAGILLLLTEPFRIGDQIVVGEFEGTVEKIQTRATFIRTYDNRRVVIPNAQLFTESVVVNTAYPKRRTQYEVGIGYSDDIDRAKHLLVEAIKQVPGVEAEPSPDVIVVDIAESSVILRARWWTEAIRSNVLTVQDQVITVIKNTLTANGIDIPYPTRQILFHDQTEESDGDRARQREGWPAGEGEVPRPRTMSLVLQRLAQQLAKEEKAYTGNGREGNPDAK